MRNRSEKWDRTPVAVKWPMILLSGVSPTRWKRNTSCIEITSPSMPVISVIETMRREPSCRREACTMRLTAEAICARPP